MKRIGNLYPKIYSMENLLMADQKASKGKSGQYGVMIHVKNQSVNLELLQQMLSNKTYQTSEYTTFKVYEPKEREVYRLPYFPDRIVHHAIMNLLEPIFVSSFTFDTYSCIKGRGIHAAVKKVKKALLQKEETKYCLKMDLRKFYPTIDHSTLKILLRRKIKDRDLLWLLDEIIDSASGLPIGNYLSQYFANFYLSYFDHWIKEEKRVKYYFRYADDMPQQRLVRNRIHRHRCIRHVLVDPDHRGERAGNGFQRNRVIHFLIDDAHIVGNT
jgi:retron-type reverse transcriptase